MTIDPKQIAKMITEDPDEVNPLDNTEDKFLTADDMAWCDHCEVAYTPMDAPLAQCQNCGWSACEGCLPGGDTWENMHPRVKSSFQIRQRQGANGFWLLTCPLCPHDSDDTIIYQDV